MFETRLTLSQFAWVAAQLDAGRPEPDVLAQVSLTLTAWQQERRAWLRTIADRARQNHLDLARQYTTEYMRYREATSGERSPASLSTQASREQPSLPVAPRDPTPAIQAPRQSVDLTPSVANERPPAPPNAPKLSLYEFAMLSAELAICPQQAERAYTKYALVDAAERAREHETWRQKLREDRELSREFTDLYRSSERHFRSLVPR